MDEPMSNFHFRLMSFSYIFRDISSSRVDTLTEVIIEPGFSVLDYGCGPGSYTIPAARMVGESGKVYALDIHPLAVQRVQKAAAKKRLTNIETILSDCDTKLPDDSVDIALLYDILHELSEPDKVLTELRRVLKSGGVLSVNDHHLTAEEIIARITGKGLFELLRKGERVYNFRKVQQR
jgi:ubiquinone/menaquinone biosynthesis C-methylase UbiE